MTEQQKTIMVVDDDFDVRETLEDILSGEGYRTISAANGADALGQLESGERPNLILLDLMMPVMDGEAFCTRWRADPTIQTLPVIILSADPRGKEKARSYGATDYLGKPVQLAALLDVIARHAS